MSKQSDVIFCFAICFVCERQRGSSSLENNEKGKPIYIMVDMAFHRNGSTNNKIFELINKL